MARGREHCRTTEQVLKDRAEIARRYLQGEYQSVIGRVLGLSQQQVSVDLKAIRKEWLSSSIRDFDAAKAQELAKLDHLEREYWQGWQRSCQSLKSTLQQGKMGDGQKMAPTQASVQIQEQYGDPRFLQGIERCIIKRCEILGLEAPKKIAETDEKGRSIYFFPADVNDPEEWERTYKPDSDATPSSTLH